MFVCSDGIPLNSGLTGPNNTINIYMCVYVCVCVCVCVRVYGGCLCVCVRVCNISVLDLMSNFRSL